MPAVPRLRLPFLSALAVLGASALVPTISQAHFTLVSPPAATQQDALGNPQKAPPCGDDGTAMATNVVTPYGPGDTVTVTIDETIFHPGHYRIALAVNDPSELPPEPEVTPGATPCGSAPIDPNPAFPVLADGVFEHTEPFTEPQSIDITLPDDITCTHCTLQVIQFMSNHALNNPGGCYYHHCATLEVDGEPPAGSTSAGDETGSATSAGDTEAGSEGGQTSVDPGETSNGPGGDTDTNAMTSDGSGSGSGASGDSDEGGCSCSQSGSSGPAGMLLGLLGLVGLRTRRRRTGASS